MHIYAMATIIQSSIERTARCLISSSLLHTSKWNHCEVVDMSLSVLFSPLQSLLGTF